MQGHPHDTNNTQIIIHQSHGHQPKPSPSTTPKPTLVHSTQAEFTTAAPCQLPCTFDNSDSLNQTQQCLQNSPNSVPEPTNQSPMIPITSIEPCSSYLRQHCANNNDHLDQLLIKIQDLSNTFQNFSTALSLLITWTPPPNNLACIQPQVSHSPQVDKPTPGIPPSYPPF